MNRLQQEGLTAGGRAEKELVESEVHAQLTPLVLFLFTLYHPTKEIVHRLKKKTKNKPILSCYHVVLGGIRPRGRSIREKNRKVFVPGVTLVGEKKLQGS